MQGIPAKMNLYASAGHSGVVKAGQPDAFQWIGDRLNGVPVSDACTETPRPAITRGIEPVVLKGAALPRLLGLPVNQLFVYAYEDESLHQVPYQVDEVTRLGAYTAVGDGIFDGQDELVFMAQDVGAQSPDASDFETLPIGPLWYAIEVTDPISPTQHGWAYVVQSAVLTPTATTRYVNWQAEAGHIQGQTYEVGFPGLSPWLDYLALGDGPNILDRTKSYLDCSGSPYCPITEEKLPPMSNRLVKNGPVRVIVRDGGLIGYGSLLTWRQPYQISAQLVSPLRSPQTFRSAATGAIFYNALVTDGITIDGVADSVASQPASPWWQISADSGSLVWVTDLAAMGATPSNYYRDSAVKDWADTGDRLHYGDTGYLIAEPSLSFDYRYTIFALPENQPNAGTAYAAFLAHPLAVKATLRGGERQVYLPGVWR